MIKPSIGLNVHYHPATDHPDHGQTLTAFICKVNPDGTLNLAIFDSCGHQFSRQRVVLFQEIDIPNDARLSIGYCTWMPYQLGQAAKTEQVIRDTDHALMRHVAMEQEARSAGDQANAGWERSDLERGTTYAVDERGVPVLDIPINVAGNGMQMVGDLPATQAEIDEATRLAGE